MSRQHFLITILWVYYQLTFLTIFVLVGSKQHTTNQNVNVEYRKIDDNAINNIKAMLMATYWSDMFSMDVQQQFKKIVDVIHEYMNIHAPPRVSKLPQKK